MTSNLQELKTALYEDFDKARERAANTHYSSNAGLAQSAALFMQAAAKTAENIIALELATAPEVQPEQQQSTPKRPTLVTREVDGRGGFGNRG